MKDTLFDSPSFPRLITVLNWMEKGELIIHNLEPLQLSSEKKPVYCEFMNSIINGHSIGEFIIQKSLVKRSCTIFGENGKCLSFLSSLLFHSDLIHFDAKDCVFVCEGNENTVPLKSFFSKIEGEELDDFTLQLHKRGDRDMARKAENARNLILSRNVTLLHIVTDDMEDVFEAVRLREKKWEF